MIPVLALPAAVTFLIPYVEPIIASTVVDRLAKFGRDTDWTMVKTDVNAKVKSVLPDAVFSPEAEERILLFIDQRVSDFAAALQDTATEKAVIDALLTGNVTGAWHLLAAKVIPALPVVGAAS